MAENATVSSRQTGEDPLIAALPPATDYLTYLTLLEYQLKPSNLSTLNRLLSEDDGKLAEEIGWDLLRLVLPMIREAPQAATNCLQVIARRGNPREVVIRVAEELERMGQLDEDEDSKSTEDEAELSTFTGEATRIHLGRMTLDGMPEADSQDTNGHTDRSEERSPASAEPRVEYELSVFQALLSVLSTIHPRIKTQYPSRFLATSLPAALGAYRRTSITAESTKAFITCLRKLSGKQRPALPPRPSTARLSGMGPPASAPDTSAPLPDPEAAAEAAEAGFTTASDNEKAIIQRLLQAVLLEILDEYLSSLQHHESASMHWVSRLRERLEPKRTVPGRENHQERWQTEAQLKVRDDLMGEMLSLTTQLGLDTTKELLIVTGHEEGAADTANESEISEYPTLPSHVPFPTAGLIEMAAAQVFTHGWTPESAKLDIAVLFQLTQTLSANPILPSPPVQDALCSILYQALLQADSKFVNSLSESAYQTLCAMLTQIFAISPYPQTRDDAHHIAKRLLQAQESPKLRMKVVKQLLRCSYKSDENETIPLAPPYSEGTLKAIGIDWLKDEASKHIQHPTPSLHDTIPVSANGIDPQVLETDKDLERLVFPNIPALTTQRDVDPDVTTSVLLSLPFYISILNLACILFSGSTPINLPKTLQHAEAMLSGLKAWKDYLVDQLTQDDAVKDSASDIFALEDACLRAGNVLVKSNSVNKTSDG